MRSATPSGRNVGSEHDLLRERSGRGIPVAVLDSGLNPENPHVTPPARAVSLEENDGETEDVLDRLGHGTAVAAVIQEKAPDSELLVVRIFHETLSTDTSTLVRGLDRAVEMGARLVNLSLGTAEPERREALRAAVARTRERGVIIVSPREHRGRRWWPGALEGVVGVLLDWDCPRDEFRLIRDPSRRPVFRASGYPRPIPGVSRARNVKGISFAAANVTGLLARLLEAEPGLRTAEEIATRVEAADRADGRRGRAGAVLDPDG